MVRAVVQMLRDWDVPGNRDIFKKAIQVMPAEDAARLIAYSSFQVGAPASSRAGLGGLLLWMQMAQFERFAREDAGAPSSRVHLWKNDCPNLAWFDLDGTAIRKRRRGLRYDRREN